MKTFSLGPGLVVRREFDVLEWEAKCGAKILFRSLLSSESVELSECDFFDEFRRGIITIADAVSTPEAVAFREESPIEPRHENLALAQLPPKHQQEVLRRIRYIRRIQASGISRGRTHLMTSVIEVYAKELADDSPPRAKTLWRWIKAYEESGGDIGSVVPGYVERGKAPRTSFNDEGEIQDAIERHYMTPARKSKMSAYLLYRNDGNRARRGTNTSCEVNPLVSYSTFVRRIAARPQFDIDASRQGTQFARKKYRMTKGHFPDGYPLDFAEIDHTPVNVWVIDDRTNLPLGGPNVTAIKDRSTGIALGMYVTFMAASVQSIFGALRHSLDSHAEALKLWPSIENPWPSFGLARSYVSDRAPEFLSLAYQLAIDSLGSENVYCERHTPWHKPSIERHFGTMESTMYENFPSRSFASLALRGDFKPGKMPIVRFSTFVYLMHKWAVDVYNVTPDSDTGISPLERWQEGIVLAPPHLPANLEQLDTILGIHGSGRLTKVGITYSHMTYANDYLHDLLKFVGVGARIDYVVVPNDLGYIYVVDPRTKKNVPVPNTRPDYASGLSLYQHKLITRLCRERYKAVMLDHLPAVRAAFCEEVAENLDRSSSGYKKRIARFAGINSESTIRGEQRSVLDVIHPKALFSAKDAVESATDVKRPAWSVAPKAQGTTR